MNQDKNPEFYKIDRGHPFLKVLGITLLALLMIVNIAGASPFAYIPNEESSNVSIIDISNNTVVASVTVGGGPVGVAVSPDEKKVYVTNIQYSFCVIDTATNSVTATLNIGSSTDGIAVSPDGKKVYFCRSEFVGTKGIVYNGTIDIIDTSTNSIIGTVEVGSYPHGIIVSPDGTKVYTTNELSNNVSVIDTSTNKVAASVNTGRQPEGVAVSPDGKRVYVANIASNNISVIDTSNNTVVASVTVGAGPVGVAVSPDGKYVYVTNEGSNNVSVIDASNNIVTANVKVGSYPFGISITPDGTKVYVANSNNQENSEGTVSVIETSTNSIIDTVKVGKFPFAFGQFIVPSPAQLIIPPVQQLLPVSNFTSNVSSGNAPLMVQFNDSSQYATSWNWDFGDGATSTEQNLTHTYGAGNYIVNLTVSNTNGTDSKLATINVSKSIPTLTWNNPTNITYGTALSNTQLDATASVPGSFIYTPGNETVLSTGTQTLHVEFTPTDTGNYTNASKDVTINVNKATPTISWSNPADIIYGTALNSTQLNAAASVPGTFVYTPVAGTILSAGAQTLKVDFTPSDTANYSNASADVFINVSKAIPTISWSSPADITYGTPLSNAQLNAAASVPGTFVYTPPAGTMLNIGTQTLHIDFTSTDSANYTTTSKDVTINVLEKPTVPVADFWASPTIGKVSLNVQFTDKSSGVPTSWLWDFGDKSTSAEKNPVHQYTKAGKYTVSLTVKNALGSKTRKISNYIIVNR